MKRIAVLGLTLIAISPGVVAAPAGNSAEVPFGLGSFDHDEPISIRSDELEAVDDEGARHLVFKRNVHVTQADVELHSDWLEAFYPEGEKQPERLVARGHVAFNQGSREARCEQVTYDRTGRLLVCTGHAVIEEAGDSLRGDRIEFDLATERMRATGNPELVLRPREEGTTWLFGREAPVGDASPPAARDPSGPDEISRDEPMAIRAELLEAFATPETRQIVFEREVVVARGDATLRAERLQAFYPGEATEPDRMVATGSVRFSQGAREARCDQAVYYRSPERVDCRGDAMLQDGDDQVHGDAIAFDLVSESVLVTGGTRLLIHPREGRPALQ